MGSKTVKVPTSMDIPKDFTGHIDCGDYQAYQVDGRWHREDDAAVIYADGSEWWYINGELHRDDGPAIHCLGDKPPGRECIEYHVHGKEVDKPTFELYYMLKYRKPYDGV